MIFTDRQQAGQLLGKRLASYKGENSIILALPRGGVPVASEIATALKTPLDVLVVRKIGYPLHPEVALGAICENDEPLWNEQLLSQTGLRPEDLTNTVLLESEKIKRQIRTFREGRPLPSLFKKTVIVVDDGLATGATVAAALEYLKKQNVAKIVVAIPIAADSSARRLRSQVDSVVTVVEPEDLMSVGQWYDDFSQVSDDEVIEILKLHRPTAPQQTLSP
jgi:predicted phosphoribosyltransferase